MTDNNTRPKYSDPEKYRVLDGGAIYGLKEGRIVAHQHKGDGKYQITPEKGRAMIQRRKELGMIAQMRALAASEGIELPEGVKLEELMRAAATGVEALTLHMLKTFKASKNLRGMAESFSKLTTGFLDTDRGQASDLPPLPGNTVALIFQLLEKYENRPDSSVDGEILEEPKGG